MLGSGLGRPGLTMLASSDLQEQWSTLGGVGWGEWMGCGWVG